MHSRLALCPAWEQPPFGKLLAEEETPGVGSCAERRGCHRAGGGGTHWVPGNWAARKGSRAPDPAWDIPGGRWWGGCWQRWRRWRGVVSAPAATGDER